MKIVWIVGFPLNDVCRYKGYSVPVSGNWLDTALNEMRTNNEIEITVICFNQCSKDGEEELIIDSVHYVVFNIKKHFLYGLISKKRKKRFNQILTSENPDVIHVHGTETALAKMIDSENRHKYPVCISLQGLISVISKNYINGGLKLCRVSPFVSVPMFAQKVLADIRGKNERDIIKTAHYFLGRTDWDRAHLAEMSNHYYYFKSAEIMRSTFSLSEPWDIHAIERHSIFCAGGCRQPLKGFHQVLKAACIVKKRYNDLKIYVTGALPAEASIKGAMGYYRYIGNFIKKNNLMDTVVFLGNLSAEEMAAQFRKSNCYVMSSCIENSPNTLCEAMKVGTPIISSLAGGVLNFIRHNENALLYRYEETEMLAAYIIKLFDDDVLCEALSATARKDGLKIGQTTNLVDIYRCITKTNPEEISNGIVK